jgi:hypothetical protein
MSQHELPNLEQSTQVRSIARQLARKITADEMEWVAGGTGTSTCTCGAGTHDPIEPVS